MSNLEIAPSAEEAITEMVENATAAGKNLYEAFQDFLGFPESSSERNTASPMQDKPEDKAKTLQKILDPNQKGDAKNTREWPDWN